MSTINVFYFNILFLLLLHIAVPISVYSSNYQTKHFCFFLSVLLLMLSSFLCFCHIFTISHTLKASSWVQSKNKCEFQRIASNIYMLYSYYNSIWNISPFTSMCFSPPLPLSISPLSPHIQNVSDKIDEHATGRTEQKCVEARSSLLNQPFIIHITLHSHQ